MLGQDELLRRNAKNAIADLKPRWQSVAVEPDGVICIQFVDHGEKITIQPSIRPAPHSPICVTRYAPNSAEAHIRRLDS